jgi:hypothetical protein
VKAYPAAIIKTASVLDTGRFGSLPSSHYENSLSPGYREVVEAYPAAIIKTASVLDTGRLWKPTQKPL